MTRDIYIPGECGPLQNGHLGHLCPQQMLPLVTFLMLLFGNCLGGSGPLRKSQNLTFSVVTHLIPLLGDLGCPPKKEFHIMGVMLTVGVTNTEHGGRERGGWREGGRWEGGAVRTCILGRRTPYPHLLCLLGPI